MSLNKLFNGKYLLQNIKKSKMTIALFFILVPVFTSLMIIASEDYTFEFGTLGLVNIFGMYIIPFIFSICLFGYVFKKNSVDFIGSMPISRKSIFITNTIGGIILILLMQVVTFFLTLLISSLTKGIIFTSMAYDILIFQTVAYIFVFVASNLAMSLSGNLVTQIAVTMLIVFIVPFSTWYVKIMSDDMHSNLYKLMNNEIEIMEVSKIENYTAPFLIANDGTYEYNMGSMWKMIILSVVYFAIGYIAFHKRKMEMAGESFENKYVHFIVKGLTLIPFVAVLKGISGYSELTLSAIIMAIILVYYIIFDLITSKKIKIWENMIAAIVSIATIYGVYSIAININGNIEKKLELNSVKSVNINISNMFHIKITDKNRIKSSIGNLSKVANNYSYYNDAKYDTEITLVKNDSTKFKRTVYVNGKMLKEMFDASFKNNVIGSKAIISNEQVKLSQKETEDILQCINESFKNLELKDLLNARSDLNYANIILNEYKNHEVVRTYYPVILNKDIQKILIAAYNRYAIEYLKGVYSRPYYTIDSFDKFNEETRQKIWFVTERVNNGEITEFILNHENDMPEDISKCIKIATYKFTFYTDKIDEFLAIVNQICEENKEVFEEYKKGYSDDDYSSFPKRVSSFTQTTDGKMIENYPTAVNETNIPQLTTSGESLQEHISGDTI